MQGYFVLAVLLLWSSVDPPAPPSDPADVAALQESSYVNSSFEAEEALRKARDRADRGDWSGAARALQEVAAKFGSHVTRVERGRYIGVRRLVQTQIAHWPAPGLRAYRDGYERTAQTEFEQAAAQRELAKLVQISETYFSTQTGASALDTAAQLAMESGDFASAIQWYGDLLALHPDRAAKGPEWRAKQALARAWAGDLAPLKDLAAGPRVGADEGKVSCGGRDRTVQQFARDTLAELESADSPPFHEENGASPAQFCGGGDRRAFFRSGASAEAMLWKCRLYDTDDSIEGPLTSAEDGSEAGVRLRAIQSGRLLTASPVFGDGLLFVSNGRTVWAVNPAAPEQPAWRFDVSDPSGPPQGWISEDEPPDQHTLLFAGHRVYAALDREISENDTDASRRLSLLICLDAQTGKVIWKSDLTSLASRFEELSLDGAPILHANRLYTMARRRKGFGFEACLLLCIRPADGKLLWSAHVGEAATGSYGYTHPTRSLPCALGDRIFVHSNLGTVAAVSALTGHVVWLTTYVSRYADESEAAWPTRFGQPLRPWQYQPSMIWRDAVVCAPMDLDELLVVDQANGRIRRRTPMDQLFNSESILGLQGDRLYAAGAQVVCYDLSRDEVAWQRPLSEGRIFGRGAITSTGVFVPTTTALLRYPLDGGPATAHRWRIENAGNLLPLTDQIVVAASDTISGLLGRDEAFARLEVKIKENPNEPDAMLALAELAFSVEEDARGLKSVEETLGWHSGQKKGRDRKLFDRVLRMAGLILTDSAPATPDGAPPRKDRIDTVIQLVESAGRVAPDAERLAVSRLLLARLHLDKGRPAKAVELYQEILSQAELRDLRLSVQGGWAPAIGGQDGQPVEQESSLYLLAEEWIGELIEQHGRDVYAPVEVRAQVQLKGIRGEAHVAGAIPDSPIDTKGQAGRLAATFPNSQSALDALLIDAGERVARGDVFGANHSVRLALSRLTTPRRVETIRTFAQSRATLGDLAEARQWLDRGIRDFPGEAFAQLRARLIGDAAPQNWPIVTWPVKPGYRCLFPSRPALLTAIGSVAMREPHELLLTYSTSKIEARNPATGKSIWPEAVTCPSLPILLGADGERLCFAGAHSLFALTRTSGIKAWQFGIEEDNDPLTDPEELETWTDHVLVGGRIISSSDRGDVICVGAADGVLHWRRELEGGTASHLAADARYVYCAKWRGRSNVIHLIDTITGVPRGEVACEDSRPIQLLHPLPDGGVLVVMARCVLRIDPATRGITWSYATPRHFLVSTFLADIDGFILSDNGRTLTKRDYLTGRLLWRTPPMGGDERDGLWTSMADGRVLVASRDTMSAFDSADGRALWTATSGVSLRWQPPVVTNDSVLTVVQLPETKSTSAPEKGGDSAGEDAGPSYRVTRLSLADGKVVPMTLGGPLRTDPMETFSGVAAYNRAIVIIDGPRLIGYVGD